MQGRASQRHFEFDVSEDAARFGVIAFAMIPPRESESASGGKVLPIP
jgi:hypothetical protein